MRGTAINLQYNALVCWADGTKDLSTKRLMFQVLFFFHKILQNSLKTLSIYFSIFYEITKIEIKSFECPKSIMKKKKYLERHMLGRTVTGPIVPANQHIVL